MQIVNMYGAEPDVNWRCLGACILPCAKPCMGSKFIFAIVGGRLGGQVAAKWPTMA